MDITFTGNEVITALKQIHHSKTPGLDGFYALFFQKYWSIINNEVWEVVLRFLNENMDISEINKTVLYLNLKLKNPTVISKFCPISLCSVVCKLISKVLANRLKVVLPHIIDESQSAFVSNKLIIDNFIMAFKAFHWLNTGNQRNNEHMVIKLDMRKAYDRVESKYLA